MSHISLLPLTLTITELSEHKCHELIPAGEALDITVPSILVYKMAKLVIVEKFYQLSENVFIFVHFANPIMDCKITNSNRRNLKLTPKRLYINYFKEQLVHFYGTVVISDFSKHCCYSWTNLFATKNANFDQSYIDSFLSLVDEMSGSAENNVFLSGSNGSADQLTNWDGTKKLGLAAPEKKKDGKGFGY